MSRRHVAEKRPIIPDPKFGSDIISHFVNHLMEQGRKSVAEKIVYGSLEAVSQKLKKPPLEVIQTVVDNVKPVLEVKSRRVGGATYQVPVEVPAERQRSLALRWIIDLARNRKGVAMIDALTSELVDAHNKTGAAVKKREDTHKMAEANRAFAHYKW